MPKKDKTVAQITDDDKIDKQLVEEVVVVELMVEEVGKIVVRAPEVSGKSMSVADAISPVLLYKMMRRAFEVTQEQKDGDKN